jgi:putative peptide zinc metalloprotease protein
VDERRPTGNASASERLVLVPPDGRRVPVDGPLTIGRGEEASVRLDDRTVSRLHVRITESVDGPLIEDAGSSYGTLLSGGLLTEPSPLRSGSTIRLGEIAIRVEPDARIAARPTGAPSPGREASGPNETIVVPVDATLMGLRPAAPPASGVDAALRPRVRSGWALKRLVAEDGEERFVLHDLRHGQFLQMEAADATLFGLLEGQRSVGELLDEAQRLVGPGGPGRLARLVADLADRGLLEGVAGSPRATPHSRLQKIFKPRDRTLAALPDCFERVYRDWGRVFFAPLPATFLALFALAGFGVFAHYAGTIRPFYVAGSPVLGVAVFITGRFALVAAHELAHGLALAHYGRKAVRVGLRLVLIFPYAFVDTSEAYFEPRSHRIVISAAGPASDSHLERHSHARAS